MNEHSLLGMSEALKSNPKGMLAFPIKAGVQATVRLTSIQSKEHLPSHNQPWFNAESPPHRPSSPHYPQSFLPRTSQQSIQVYKG